MQFNVIVSQFFDTLSAIPEAWQMIRERRLWRGIDRYGWVTKVLVVAAVLFGWSFLKLVIKWFGQLSAVDSPGAALSSVGNLAGNLAMEGYESFTSGLMKYVILLLSEVIIYHFMQRALEELMDKPVSTRFQDFLDAQIRMLKVVFPHLDHGTYCYHAALYRFRHLRLPQLARTTGAIYRPVLLLRLCHHG